MPWPTSRTSPRPVDRSANVPLQMAMRRLSLRDAKVWLKRLIKELGQMRIAVIAAGALADPGGHPLADRSDEGPQAGPGRR